jgi:hypothetical protein
MARTQIEQKLFENDGAGPKIRKDILPLATAATPGMVKPGTGLKVAEDGALSVAQVTAYSVTITTSGSFTAPYDGYYRARVWGGGGAGGGAYSPITAVGIAAAGGHSGGYGDGVVYLTKNQTVAVTIGAGGVGVIDNDGGNGGSSSFASVSAPGGQGGEGYSGTTAGYYFVCNRRVPVTGSQPGFPGQDVYAVTAGAIAYIASGAGASSLVGSGGPGALGSGTSASHGTAATGYASGGGGAWFQSGATNHMRGGNGSPGVVIVDFIGV